MRKLIAILTLALLATSLVAQSKMGGTAKVGGTVKSGYAASAPRGIILNGTTQNAHRTLPNSAPFTSLGAFQMIYRVRSPSPATNFLFQMRNSGETPQWDVSLNFGSTQWVFNDYRDSTQMFLTPNTMSDSKYKLQYDPTNSRWTWESWDNDDTDHVQTTLALTTTTNWSLGNGLWTIGSTYYDANWLAVKVDWFRWSDQIDALNTSPPSNTFAVGPTYRARWEFENNGVDSAAVAGDFTLAGSPSYENTP